MKKLIILITVIAFSLSACTKDNTTPNTTPGTNSLQEDKTPTPCFTMSKEVAAPGESINFTSCSANGFNYEWDFGDGSSSTIQDPSKVYDKSGTYTITLKVLTKEKTKFAETAKTIKIGRKQLTKITVNKISFTDKTGAAWDWGGYPDLKFYFGKSSQTNYEYHTDEKSDVQAGHLPVTWEIKTSVIILTKENWKFGLYDQDVTEDEGMVGWSNIDMGNYNTSPLKLTGSGYDIDIYWEIK